MSKCVAIRLLSAVLLFGASSARAVPLVSPYAQPGLVHVVIDVCPDAIMWAKAAGSSEPVVSLWSDDVWIGTPSVYLFHANGVGSLHEFDLASTIIGLHPELYPFEHGRGYGYNEVKPTGETFRYEVLPFVSIESVPEPSTESLVAAAAACLVGLARRR